MTDSFQSVFILTQADGKEAINSTANPSLIGMCHEKSSACSGLSFVQATSETRISKSNSIFKMVDAIKDLIALANSTELST